eukprot:CAMPEP_0114335732 /NCGR_PEP_ID=MMETSP0101-20121206/5245_1 /TAXON_ID=38822 ORGANISM="Pteridomonas danica, Strain PT" /NCGR_SAMPLE_ID=MMETSP0101 /ASSEMBLY_ACC=CAM_ASM_000211 /LENGTH=512 /DNA_ID=CAMNT_0001467437 /DNA_START=67 /DNA_END=1605 /DNA_ORIENTATION=-
MPAGSLLQKALKNVKNKDESSPHYDQFIHSRKYLEKKGWSSMTDGSCSLGMISLKFMFSFPRAPHNFEALNEATTKATVEKRREHISNHSRIQSELVDGSLLLIFSFYCKIQAPGSKLCTKPTFGDIAESNQCLSYLGMVTFLRDFSIIPKYILSEDVAGLWRAQTVARHRMLGHSDTAKRVAVTGTLAFLEFLEFLCKIGLFAFSEETDSLAVEKLADKLRLREDDRVRYKLSRRGALSNSRINDPTAEDARKETSHLLLEESTAKFGAKRQSKERASKRAEEPEKERASKRAEETERERASKRAEERVVTREVSKSSKGSSKSADTIRFNTELRDTVEWQRRYGELIKEQSIVPTSDFDLSALQLSPSILKVLGRYHPHLIEELQLFIFAVRRSWAAIHVPALDLGVLQAGSIYTVQVMVKNSFSVPITVSPPTVRGNALEQMTTFTIEAVTTIYPGLCFNFLVEVLPHSKGPTEVVGSVDLQVKLTGKEAATQKTWSHAISMYYQIAHK